MDDGDHFDHRAAGVSDARFTSPMSSEATTSRFTIDEGFAEGSSHHLEGGRAAFDATAAHFQQWIQAQGPEVRADVAYEILRTLRTSQISTIVDKLTPLLHMDPLEKLPVEVTSMIFSHLDAHTLLTASLASQTWRERILDPRLWQELYRREGWRVDTKEIRAFEAEHADLTRAEYQKARSQSRQHAIAKGQPLFKRRATSDWLESKPRRISADVATWREQHGVVEADTDAADGGDQEMYDAGSSVLDSPSRPNKRQNDDSGDEMDYSQDTGSSHTREAVSTTDLLVPDFLLEDGQGKFKMNWPYLFKQRYKLEDNWLRGRYTNFQLPHPNFAYEAHTECVYTIQFHGRWLVSGSRDKTLRVWDLKTRRLRGKPLVGHAQSVLCLQFDPSEDEDVIISGSSDSSVIVWKFSTGQRLHVIPSAHEESVLNLKFDRRYLVTCSKDRKIKIWNRHTLTPLHEDYPRISPQSHARVPSYIIDTAAVDPSILEARLANGQIKSLQPYMHLMTLEGHGAAVNAIQINGDLVVSASGDRLIRVWSIKDGVCLRVLPGHQKGIACVQFDKKRIVSGSSDHTVRVYDLMTGVELAVLHGHQNLVRTVQAGFGDTPGSEEDDLAAARAAEQSCMDDLISGRVVEDRQFIRRLRNGESGSSRTGLGSRLPPGGGGSKWGRIVSGSYDESIIIWKKDAKGQWVPGQTLRQDAVVRANIETDGARPPGPARARRRHETVDQQAAISASQIVQQAVTASVSGLPPGVQNVGGAARALGRTWAPATRPSNSQGGPANAPVNSMTPAVQSAVNQIVAHAQIAAANVIQQAANRGHVQIHANLDPATSSMAAGTASSSRSTQPSTGPSQAPTSSVRTTYLPPASQPTSTRTTNVPPASQPSTSRTTNLPPGSQPSVRVSSQTVSATLGNNVVPGPATQQTPGATAAAALPNEPPTQNNPNPPNSSVSRVFKLQFDARRIVCCSQDSRIIGWDFTNGDPEIDAACQFFVGP